LLPPQLSQQSLRWNKPLQKFRKRWLEPQPQSLLQPQDDPLKQLGRVLQVLQVLQVSQPQSL
jgi:hypothetical protein